jgi:hypothetical protein
MMVQLTVFGQKLFFLSHSSQILFAKFGDQLGVGELLLPNSLELEVGWRQFLIFW